MAPASRTPWLARKPLSTTSANAPGRWSTWVARRPKCHIVKTCCESSGQRAGAVSSDAAGEPRTPPHRIALAGWEGNGRRVQKGGGRGGRNAGRGSARSLREVNALAWDRVLLEGLGDGPVC